MATTKRATLLLTLKDKASKGLNKIGGKLNALGGKFGGVGLGLGIVGVALAAAGTAAIKAAGQIEQWTISFTTMLGSADRADILLGKIKKFAKETPFDLPQVVKGGRALLAFGIEADKVIPTMKSLGDVSAGLGVPMERLILNFGQVKAQAKLTGRELRDFAVAGVPLLAVLAKNLNKTEAEIQDMVSKGKIGFREVEQAFKSMSGEGGRFANLMEKQMDSLEGKFSNVKDVIFQLAAEIGEAYLPAAKKLLDVLIKTGESLLKTLQIGKEKLSDDELTLEHIEREIEARERLIAGENQLGILQRAAGVFKSEQEAADDRASLKALFNQKNQLTQKIAADKKEKKMAAARKKRIELEMKGRLIAEGKMVKARIGLAKKLADSRLKLAQERRKSQEDTLNFISALTQAKTKELVLVGKAATIALIIMNTQVAAAGARAAFNFIPIVGPALGNAAFAAVIASGAVQVAKVAGINLQEGGIIQPRAGGTSATLGEAGQAEAVIPLDDDESGSIGGLGGITINVGVLVGGEDNVKELAQMIDKEIFDLRRNNESVAFESV